MIISAIDIDADPNQNIYCEQFKFEEKSFSIGAQI